jgi:hypothetical protein
MLVTLAAGYSAYLGAFTGFASYDDEGYLLITVKEFLKGGVLYNHIYSQYGPVYYLFQWLLHSLTGAPVSHNVVRLSLLLPWLGSSLLCAWLVYRIARSIFFALLAHFLVFMLLRELTFEPGHPQELCLLLLAVLAAAAGANVASGRVRAAVMITFGVCCAALTLTKINAGTYACGAVGLLLATFTSGRRFPRYIYLAASIASLSIPIILFSVHLNDTWGQRFFFVVLLSIGAAILNAWRTDEIQCLRPRDWVFMLAAFGVTCAIAVGFVLARGTTMAALLNSTILDNLGVAGRWYIALNMRFLAVPWAAGALVLAALSIDRERLPKQLATAVEEFLPYLKLAYGVVVAISALLFPHLVLVYAAPFVWLVIAAPSASRTEEFARTAVGMLGAFETLYAYPVAGTQIRFATVLIVVAGVICLSDGIRAVRVWVPSWRGAEALASLLLLCGYGYQMAHAYSEHYSRLPLDLPGAASVRVDAQQKAKLHWMTASTASCDTFISTPGLDSLYFWTGKEPPNDINVDNWMNLLTDAQQEDIVRAFAAHPKGCVLYSPQEVHFWLRGQDLSAMPLGRYILDHFRIVDQRYGYLLMIRKDRSLRTWNSGGQVCPAQGCG